MLVLENGNYNTRKIIYLDKILSIVAKNKQQATLSFERGTFFELLDGGSLTLDGLVIDGRNSPDYSGNTLVRTKKWGMTKNYRLVIQNSRIQNLDINHSFHVFESGKGAFADQITFDNNSFINISGDILRLNKEIEDLGVYNAEYVTLTSNEFTQVKGALVKLYRGGSDESTFGPHLLMSGNKLADVGNGKRNKVANNSSASVYLHGVQVTDIKNNQLMNSAPIVVEHTVGEPITRITNNQLSAKPSVVELRVAELRAKGEHTAHIQNNQLGTGDDKAR